MMLRSYVRQKEGRQHSRHVRKGRDRACSATPRFRFRDGQRCFRRVTLLSPSARRRRGHGAAGQRRSRRGARGGGGRAGGSFNHNPGALRADGEMREGAGAAGAVRCAGVLQVPDGRAVHRGAV